MPEGKNNRQLKIAYLFNGPRSDLIHASQNGEAPDDHLFGLSRLRAMGHLVDYLEPEQFFSPRFSRILRRWLSVYFIHLSVWRALGRYDLVFAPTAYGTQLWWTLLRCRRPRWVMYDFSITGLIGQRQTWRQRIFSWMVSRADGIVALSHQEIKRLITLFPELKSRVVCVPFGTDVDFFRPLDLPEEHQIIAVGLDPGRDYRTLFAAAARVGVPVLATRSRTLAAQAQIPAGVRVEHFSWPDLVKAYARSKIVALPLDISAGLNDAMGSSTLVQAMSCGKAVIATRTPTTETYIENGVTGILVEPQDEFGWQKALERLLADGDERRRLGQAARDFILRECAAPIAASRLASFFVRVVEGGVEESAV